MPNWAQAFNHEQLAVNTVVGITLAEYFPAANASVPATTAIVTVDPTNPIRWTMDGTTPSSTVGHYLVNDSLTIEGFGNIKAFRMIKQGATNAGVSVTLLR
jgi:hypothetical protein